MKHCSQCISATAPAEQNIPGADLPGTERKDTMTGKHHVVTKQKEYNLEFLPTFWSKLSGVK